MSKVEFDCLVTAAGGTEVFIPPGGRGARLRHDAVMDWKVEVLDHQIG